jgi:hypothetical protein
MIKEAAERAEHKKMIKQKKVQFQKNKPMKQVLQENNKRIREEKLSPKEIYQLKRINLLAIQDRIYAMMEKNPSVFKIPHLLYHRKKVIKNRGVPEDQTSVKIDPNLKFSKEIRPEVIVKRTKLSIFDYMDKLKKGKSNLEPIHRKSKRTKSSTSFKISKW